MRYSAAFPNNFEKNLRPGTRAIGQAASQTGATGISSVGYAAVDAARAIALGDHTLALRAIDAAAEGASSALRSAEDGFWAEILNDLEFLHARGPFNSVNARQTLASRKLWERTPSWISHAIRNQSRVLGSERGAWEFWIAWYSARLRGQRELDLTPASVEALNLRISHQTSSWWHLSPREINSTIYAWIDRQPTYDSKIDGTVSDLVFDFVNRQDGNVNINDILNYYLSRKIHLVRNTVRGELSRLAAYGRITRISNGLYTSSKTEVLDALKSLGPVERQTKGALQFQAHAGDAIEIKARASAGELLKDSRAISRHDEVVRRIDQILLDYGPDRKGSN